ncbi:MAG: polysaccharide biosynthesis tyrosine autokinase [Flavobacteriaceae bacterium]|jgi:capsular exopolysaccharide synthesis family protein|nr:polysaccharide biosynthesis tyrosine autokinase [Flavobacteriaceae bacterium]
MLDSKDFLQEDNQSKFDFRGFIFKTLSYWKWFLLSWLIAFFIAYNVNIRKEKIYAIDTTIAVKEESNPFFTSTTSLVFNWGGTSDQVQNIITTIKSRTHNEFVIDRLHYYIDYLRQGEYYMRDVYGQTPFTVKLEKDKFQLMNRLVRITFISNEEVEVSINFTESEIRTIRYDTKETGMSFVAEGNFKEKFKVNQPIRLPYLNFTIDLKEDAGKIDGQEYFIRFNNFDRTVSKYREIKADVNNKAPSIIKLTHTGTNKNRLVEYLNSTVEMLIRRQLDRKNQFATNTINFIDSNLVAMEKQLKDNEQEIKEFSKDKNIYELEKGGERFTQQLLQYDLEKDRILRKVAYFDNLKNYLNRSTDYSKLPAPSVAGIEESNVVGNVSKLVSLSKEREELAYMTKNQKWFEDFDKEISALKKVILENIVSAKEVLDIDLRQVNAKMGEIESAIKKLPVQNQEYLRISRKFNLNEIIFTSFLQKRNEAEIVKAANLSDVHFIDSAKDIGGGQVGPNTAVNYIMAFMLGLIIPVIIVFTIFFLENSILNTDEIIKKTNIPIIGVVGIKTTDSDLAVFEKPKSALSESFRAIRSSLQYMYTKRKIDGAKTLMVTSSISGEGKTFCSINIATVFALSEKKTVILGMDLRKPRIFDDFRINNDLGVVNYLVGQKNIEGVIQKTHNPYLDIITSGPIPPNPSELIIGEQMDELINYLKKEYEYIIIDTPPVGLVSDAIELSPYADITLYVMRQNFTKKDMIPLLNNRVERGELKNTSIIFNGYENKAKYGTAYGYGYGYGYGYVYGSYGHGYHDDEPPRGFFRRMIWKVFKK